MTNCNCRYNCIDLAIVASIIIGIIAAALSVTGIIALTPAFLWVVGGIAVVYLAVVLVIAAFRGFCGCRQILSVLLVGIIGTILTSVILLAISFAVTSIIGTIIVGLLIIFASLIFTATACLARCFARCTDED